MQVRQTWWCLVLLTTISLQGKYTDAENNAIKLFAAANTVDGIFAGKIRSAGGGIFAVNAPQDVRVMAKEAVDYLVEIIDGTKGDLLPGELMNLKKGDILSNWRAAEVYNWVTSATTRPETKKAIGDVMSAYTSGKQRVLTNTVGRLITDDYLVLKSLAEKIDKDMSSSGFSVNADAALKQKLDANIQMFKQVCTDAEGLASGALKALLEHEVFGLWDMATQDTGWLDIDRRDWDTWKKDSDNAQAAAEITAAVGQLMTLYGKDKSLLVSTINKIFVLVRDVLVREAAILEIKEREAALLSMKDLLSANEKDALLAKAKALDEKLSKITMNASHTDKIAADNMVDEFVTYCAGSDVDAIKALADDPLIKSWSEVKKLEGWFESNLQDKTVFAAWKKEKPASYKAFGPKAKFMDAYAKSKMAVHNLVKSVIARVTGAGSTKDLEKMSKDKITFRQQIDKLKGDIAAWRPAEYKLPVFKPDTRGGALGDDDEEGQAGTDDSINDLAHALYNLKKK